MAKLRFYGSGIPYLKVKKSPGKLIVLEGTDGVGRSTQVELLKKYLEKGSFAVSDTGLRRSELTQKGIDSARSGNTLNPITTSLFYATDFADRLENQIVPSGLDAEWARKVYGFAVIPDIIFYLRADINTLVTRIVHGRGFEYWEAGMDIIKANNLYDSFCQYQKSMIEQFDKMAEEYNFQIIDANRSIADIHKEIKTGLESILER
jgi:dTMP kinase